QNNRISVVAIPPARGLIYDRNGVLLARNLPAFGLEVIPEQVADIEATLRALNEVVAISPADVKRFRRLLKQKRTTRGVLLRLRLSEEELARFAVNRPRFPGVDIVAGVTRDYPLGASAAHAVGYVGRISEDDLDQLGDSNYSGTSHIGKTGIEQTYEDVLHGTVGFEQIETNAQGQRLRVLQRTPARAGRNLYLNMDLRLQQLAEQALGDNRGAVVALEPATGAVLALVSQPGYDPNPFVSGIESGDYQALQNSPDQPLYNRALRGQYPPGSTIKPFVALAGLELGVTDTQRSTFCPGWFQLPGQERRYRDWRHEGHGTVNIITAISESCDVYFYDLAQRLGIDRLHNFLVQFGFGQKSAIDAPGELAGLLPSSAWKRKARNQPWFPGETVISGIGQGYMLATPLQLAVAAATLANRGARMPPRIVAAIEDPLTHNKVAQTVTAPLYTVPPGKSANWDTVIAAMTEVMHGERGTARGSGAGAAYKIAGKTGTAQVFGLKQDEKYDKDKVALRLRDHGLFIAFAPADNPRIAIAVIVENGGSGSGAAAPIARKLMDQYLLPSTP
ncbi:MAG: penicillin-binding protein 2, partial [Gammaproteobacteria bacterium]|nr:penicillin-binding protein 2 [Gammaproteobacteria bacterium]